MIGVNFSEIDKTTRYQLLCSAVVPRPIAFISTIDSKTGRVWDTSTEYTPSSPSLHANTRVIQLVLVDAMYIL